MKRLDKFIFAVLIGVITVAAGLSGFVPVNAAPKSKQNFTMPREAFGYLITNAAKLSPAQVEQGLWELQRLWDKTQKKYQSQLESKKIQRKLGKYRFRDLVQFRNITDTEVLQLLTNIRADGYRLINGQGKVNLKIDYSVINPKVTRYAPKPVRTYFKIIARSNPQTICVNGTLKVTPNALAARIVQAERFLKENPEFVKKAEVEGVYKQCLSFYLLGSAKTPAFKGNKLNENFLKSYQEAATKYQTDSFGKLVADYLNLLKQSNYRKTKQITEFVKSKSS